ncbi:hypothetical protein [Spiroplasma endosymbiont of Aspidapion aeneum]|uniref:hypothetical protein n=1 Tax=Spiroplasma endosymbiont of Aspidapion aeneum TaxID=3066276 RepID=UPI00313CA103
MKKQIKVLLSIMSITLIQSQVVSCGSKHNVLSKDINDWNVDRMLDNTAFNNIITNYNGYSLNWDGDIKNKKFHSAFWNCEQNDWFTGSDVPSRQLKYYEENVGSNLNKMCELIDISYFGESLLYYYEANSQNYGSSVLKLKDLKKDEIWKKITDNIIFINSGINENVVTPKNDDKGSDVGFCYTLADWKKKSGWEELEITNSLKENKDLWTPWKHTQESMSTSSFLAYYFNMNVSIPKNSVFIDSHKSSWGQPGSNNTKNTRDNRIIFVGGEASINTL